MIHLPLCDDSNVNHGSGDAPKLGALRRDAGRDRFVCPAASATSMLEQIDHVNIVVDNLEAMTRFYRERLGFKVTKQVTISGAWIDQVVGLNGVEADVVYLD